MKKIGYLVVVIIVLTGLVTGCSMKSNKKDSEGFVIGTSNKVDDDKLQVKVIIDQINLREDSSASSDKIGVVQKGAVFDVIEYTTDQKFVWFKIETNNHLVGYIASEIESPYVEINRDIDVIPPTVTVKNEIVSAPNREQLEDVIKTNIECVDDVDTNPTIEYEVNYDKSYGEFSYDVKVIVTDFSNNASTVGFRVKITGEKQLEDGKWVTYKDMVNLQKNAKSLCKKYGLSPWADAIGCELNDGVHDVLIANYTGTTRIGFYQPFMYCDYNKDLQANHCDDGNGNTISHDLIPDKLQALEKIWLEKFRNYMDDVKNTTGFDLYELNW